MIVKHIIDEDFVNYKKPSMFISFNKCSWKCEKECGMRVCQNGALAISPDIEIETSKLVARYINNPITSAAICAGLEPFDSWDGLLEFVTTFRKESEDDIVIYTGYYEHEIQHRVDVLKSFKNIVIKFGRFVPNNNPHYDDVLGVNLASDNQYAVRIS